MRERASSGRQGLQVSISVPTLRFESPARPGRFEAANVPANRWGQQGREPASLIVLGALLAGFAVVGSLFVLAWGAL